MSYNSPDYIKPDPDAASPSSSTAAAADYYYLNLHHNQQQQQPGQANPDLISRNMLTRGFSSFDDNNLSSSMIPEADLLDFEGLQSHDDDSINDGGGDFGLTNSLHDVKLGSYFSPPSSSSARFPSHVQQQQQHHHQQQNHATSSSLDDIRPQSHTQRFLYDNDYGRNVNNQSGLQSMSVPDSSSSSTAVAAASWNTPPGSFEYASPPQLPLSSSSLSSRPTLTVSSLPQGVDLDKQQILMLEKRRRRRESHNAVERRRRDNINEKIQELALLIPEPFLSGTGFANGSGGVGSGVNSGSVGTDGGDTPVAGTSATGAGTTAMTAGINSGTPITAASAAALGKDGKPNKGIILRKSVDYIRQLQAVLEEQRRKNEELERQVTLLQQQQQQQQQQQEGSRSTIDAYANTNRNGTANGNTREKGIFDDLEYDGAVFQSSPADNDRYSMDLS
ncbi:helix-loop-helix DNA-binding domain-containing protein [Lipomyces japonicus]|uniref:helix-loop-helix DNA-binding domain-containing protein n=1 Tax=Lipomyces japonicus TaxID=56871 RepID=UPI0034CFC79C